jgi:hypothetical protein
VLEVVIAVAVLTIGACGLVAVLVHSMTLAAMNRETRRATEVARGVLEQMHGVPVAEVYASYNDDPSDDPDGAGTAPGDSFAVTTKAATTGTASLVGEIIFPSPVSGGSLREDVVDVSLGMPRDLNGDGAIDSADHKGDYVILPVKIRVSWSGVAGDRSFEICALLLDQ